MATRAEHLAWAKERALEYADMGDVTQTLASLGSDLAKHPETAGHAALELGTMLAVSGTDLRTPAEIRRFVEGCH